MLDTVLVASISKGGVARKVPSIWSLVYKNPSSSCKLSFLFVFISSAADLFPNLIVMCPPESWHAPRLFASIWVQSKALHSTKVRSFICSFSCGYMTI